MGSLGPPPAPAPGKPGRKKKDKTTTGVKLVIKNKPCPKSKKKKYMAVQVSSNAESVRSDGGETTQLGIVSSVPQVKSDPPSISDVSKQQSGSVPEVTEPSVVKTEGSSVGSERKTQEIMVNKYKQVFAMVFSQNFELLSLLV